MPEGAGGRVGVLDDPAAGSKRLEIRHPRCGPREHVYVSFMRGEPILIRERCDVPAALRGAWGLGLLDFDPREASYVCADQLVFVDDRRRGALARWRRVLFCAMSRRQPRLTDVFRLPRARTVSYLLPIGIRDAAAVDDVQRIRRPARSASTGERSALGKRGAHLIFVYGTPER